MYDNPITIFIVLALVVGGAIGIVKYILYIESEREKQERLKIERLNNTIDALASNNLEMTPEEFMAFRSTKLHDNRYEAYYALGKNFTGIYILHNKTKNKYYVGQSKTVLNRVNMHFTGKGNGDVYFDYRAGDQFAIRMVSLQNSGFASLDDLERSAIARYNAYYNGYNKTRGNR